MKKRDGMEGCDKLQGVGLDTHVTLEDVKSDP